MNLNYGYKLNDKGYGLVSILSFMLLVFRIVVFDSFLITYMNISLDMGFR